MHRSAHRPAAARGRVRATTIVARRGSRRVGRSAVPVYRYRYKPSQRGRRELRHALQKEFSPNRVKTSAGRLYRKGFYRRPQGPDTRQRLQLLHDQLNAVLAIPVGRLKVVLRELGDAVAPQIRGARCTVVNERSQRAPGVNPFTSREQSAP